MMQLMRSEPGQVWSLLCLMGPALTKEVPDLLGLYPCKETLSDLQPRAGGFARTSHHL